MITKHRVAKTYRSPVSQTLFLLLGAGLLSAVAGAPVAGQSKTSPSEVREALQTSFGSAVEAVTAFDPYYLTGDFNGDGAEDILIVVRIKGRNVLAGPGVELVDPFDRGRKAYVVPLSQQSLTFAILHGGRAGWKTAPSARFLVHGESPILILEIDRAISPRADDRKSLMEIIGKSRRRGRGANRAPAAARGDAILLGTEAAEGTLYWDGKTYRWVESEGGE